MVRFVHKDESTGKKKGIVHIKGDMDFPYVVVDRHQKSLWVTCEWDWWLDDERFREGLNSDMAIVDGKGVAWTVLHVGNDGAHGPILSTEKCSYEIGTTELRQLLKEGCDKLNWKHPDLEKLITLPDLAAIAIEAWVENTNAEQAGRPAVNP